MKRNTIKILCLIIFIFSAIGLFAEDAKGPVINRAILHGF